MPKLTKTDLKKYRSLLLEHRSRLTGNIRAMEGEALKRSEQDFSVDHMADHGTDNFEQDLTLGLIENEEERLREIDEALQRIKDGTFGVCENCEKSIPKTRLKAIPHARLCVECQRDHERELA